MSLVLGSWIQELKRKGNGVFQLWVLVKNRIEKWLVGNGVPWFLGGMNLGTFGCTEV